MDVSVINKNAANPVTVRYFAVFADDGHRLYTVVADGMPYTVNDVLTANPTAVEVTPEEQLKLMNGWTRGPGGVLNPPEPWVDPRTFEQKRVDAVQAIRQKALETISASDHELLEYLEKDEPGNVQFEQLKLRRQDVRNALVQIVDQLMDAETEEELNAVNLDFNSY